VSRPLCQDLIWDQRGIGQQQHTPPPPQFRRSSDGITHPPARPRCLPASRLSGTTSGLNQAAGPRPRWQLRRTPRPSCAFSGADRAHPGGPIQLLHGKSRCFCTISKIRSARSEPLEKESLGNSQVELRLKVIHRRADVLAQSKQDLLQFGEDQLLFDVLGDPDTEWSRPPPTPRSARP